MVGYQLAESLHETGKNLAAGGIAGSMGIFIGQPLDMIKVRMQTEQKRYATGLACFLDMVRKEGFLSLYRGMAAPVMGQFVQNALIFAGESVALRYLEPDMKFQQNMSSKTVMNVFMAGSFGGLLQCLVLVPADLVKCKLQVDHAGGGKPTYAGTIDCIRHIVRTEGVGGLYKGFSVTALREVPAFGIYFFVYRYSLAAMTAAAAAAPATAAAPFRATAADTSSSAARGGPLALAGASQCDAADAFYSSPSSSPPPSSSSAAPSAPPASPPAAGNDDGPGLPTLIAGGLAGCASWLVIYPVDVVKSHVQTGSTGGSTNGLTVARELYRQYGIRAFTRGLGVTMLRAFPVNATVFYALETLKKRFGIQ
jgi:hypothetical protein